MNVPRFIPAFICGTPGIRRLLNRYKRFEWYREEYKWPPN